ncbi:nuclear transport factor 2 family protein [Sphingobacterium sp. ML3W]|uniref:nuclear transport factor 2 family protein n=1 Tax=Sphingobacterium sp. ML3W TaxID=1538644 RepID=UPI00249A88B3|nr:nuclear transport factor 2 family protein [Sphingobacterium sp. ML3W]WFA79489.1 nuclear transport factor 2 family protein [Sphingobacterium sp. ML3W]
MKTLVKTFAAAALIAVSTFAMAAEGPGSKSANVNLFTADLALGHYIAVTTEGESAGVEQLFAEDFSQKVQSANAKTNSRNEVVKYLKKQKGEKLNCMVTTDIIEESADYRIAKVTLKFEDFTKTDLVTLVREGNDWKVSGSINAYK